MKTAIPIPGRHALRQLEQALHALAADPRAKRRWRRRSKRGSNWNKR